MNFTKYVLPVVVGSAAGMFLIKMGELALGKMYTLPVVTDLNNLEPLKAAIMALPISAFMLLLVNYIIASLVSGITSTLVIKGTSAIPAIVSGVILTVGGIANIMRIPHPLWFSITNLLIYIPFAWLGYFAFRKKQVINA